MNAVLSRCASAIRSLVVFFAGFLGCAISAGNRCASADRGAANRDWNSYPLNVVNTKVKVGLTCEYSILKQRDGFIRRILFFLTNYITLNSQTQRFPNLVYIARSVCLDNSISNGDRR